MTRVSGKTLTALALVSPFVVIYGWLFIYPTAKMIAMSMTNSGLLGDGDWIGFANYAALAKDKVFYTAVINTTYFIVLTVVPGTLISLGIALMVNRLKGWMQSLVLALFFIPYILPVSVVYLVWNWMFDFQYGIAQHAIKAVLGHPVAVFRRYEWFFPAVAILTVWWTSGFNILLFLAGLRNISSEIYEAAELDGSGRWRTFREITWPLLKPVTLLVLTLQLLFNLKIFDQVYLFSREGRTETTMVVVQYIYRKAFVANSGGAGAAVATVLLIAVLAIVALQYQVTRMRSAR